MKTPSHVFSHIRELFEERQRETADGNFVTIQAPMVRYSRLPFRLLVKRYGCDIMYTHMILADPFVKSHHARDADFSTCKEDWPLVVQFASNDPVVFGKAAQLVAPYCDACDVNCGCPQRWAIQEGVGSALLKNPELIADTVRQTNRIAGGLPCAVKIRIQSDLRRTVDLARQIEHAGAVYLTMHGRTPNERSTCPVNVEAIRLVKESVQIPVIHNGSVFTRSAAQEFVKATGVNGVMSARGLLSNPALFAGHDAVPWECIEQFMRLSLDHGSIPFAHFHQQLIFMLHPHTSKEEMQEFVETRTMSGVIDYFRDRDLLNITSKQNSPVNTNNVTEICSASLHQT